MPVVKRLPDISGPYSLGVGSTLLRIGVMSSVCIGSLYLCAVVWLKYFPGTVGPGMRHGAPFSIGPIAAFCTLNWLIVEHDL